MCIYIIYICFIYVYCRKEMFTQTNAGLSLLTAVVISEEVSTLRNSLESTSTDSECLCERTLLFCINLP